MKLEAIGSRSFMNMDLTRKIYESISPGTFFEIDLETDEGKQQAHELIYGRRAVPDTIPERAEYQVVTSFSQTTVNGKVIRGRAHEKIMLSRVEGCELMVRGLVLPTDEKTWRPSDLLNPRGPVDGTTVKQMFDKSSELKTENWTQRGFRK